MSASTTPSGAVPDVARSWIEYAVRTADGYVDSTCRRIAAGGGKFARQCEGAELVARRVTTTAWHGLDERCPGHALSECLPCAWPVEYPPQSDRGSAVDVPAGLAEGEAADPAGAQPRAVS